MKRRCRTIRIALLFLIAGALINIVVATSLSQPGLSRYVQLITSPYRDTTGESRWPFPVPEHWPALSEQYTQAITGHREVTCSMLVWHDGGAYTIFRVVRIQSGWPIPALERLVMEEKHEHIAGFPTRFTPSPVPGWFRGGVPIGDQRFPIRSVLSGFILNTLLYTTLAATLWYTPGFIRRARRRRRNACQSCGYSRAGLTAEIRCPECGRAASPERGRLCRAGHFLLRPVGLLSLWLLIGSSVTVAIAWTSAATADAREGEENSYRRIRIVQNGEGAGLLSVVSNRTSTSYFVRATAGRGSLSDFSQPSADSLPQVPWPRGVSYPWIEGLAPWPMRYETSQTRVIGHGWPCIALWCRMVSSDFGPGPENAIGGLVLPERFGNQNDLVHGTRALPFMPVWSGFALNTLVYATIAATLWYTPGLIRRARRYRFGCCIQCGYSRAGLSDNTPCPECNSPATTP